MAQSAQKVRKKLVSPGHLPGDMVQKVAQKQAKRLDEYVERKGGFVESNLAQTQREAEAAQKRQGTAIARQRQQEQLRLAQSESELARRKFLRRAGGRQSLIASR